MKLTTEKWAHNSPKHHAWKAYVDAAMMYGDAKRFSEYGFKRLHKNAEDYVNSLDWRFLDE